MTSNDEDLLPANYQKHKKNMVDGIKEKRNYPLKHLKKAKKSFRVKQSMVIIFK